MSDQGPIAYTFGHCQLNLRRRELTVSGALVEIQPLVFDLLAYFLANQGRAVTKEELLDKVWRNSFGSDAVIARAILKVRRAIGDDAQEPTYLKTVHRVGYRLDVAVAASRPPDVLPQAQVADDYLAQVVRPPVLLPCLNRTGDASFDWFAQGLPGLVHHLAQGRVKLAVAPADWSAAERAADSPDVDWLARTCETVGTSDAVQPELLSTTGTLRIRILRGRRRDEATTTELEAPSIAALAQGLLELLSPGTPVARAAAGESFWQEELAKALDLSDRGAMDQAITLMDECVSRLPASAPLLLAHAAMLRRAGRRDLAGEQARAALALVQGRRDAAIEAQALFEISTQAWHTREIAESIQLLQQALETAQGHVDAAPIIPDILSFYASVLRERGDVVASIHLAERSIATSISLGDKAKEAHARVVLGGSLLHAGLLNRAGDVLRRAAELAHRNHLTLKEAFALRMLASLDQDAGRYSLAVDESRRAAALAASCGHSDMRDSARVQELVSLVYLGQLQDAAGVAARLRGSTSTAWENTFSLRYSLALLAWRRGDPDATDRIREVGDEACASGLRLEPVARLEQCFQHLSNGDLPAAERAIVALDASAFKGVAPLHARAGLALARGERAQCIETLRQALASTTSDSLPTLLIEVDLAWMLLEDGASDELSSIIGRLAELRSEPIPARLVTAAYLRLHNPLALARGEWESLLGEAPRLCARYPWIETSLMPERSVDGRARQLPELFSRACW